MTDSQILQILKDNPDLSYQNVIDILQGIEDIEDGQVETFTLDQLEAEIWDATLNDGLEDDDWSPDGL